MQEKTTPHTDKGLTRYVGEKDILEALPISRATLHRARVSGDFPPPSLKIGSRVLWRVEDVNDWEERRSKAARSKLVAVAATRPDDLSDERLREAAFAATAEHLSRSSGKPVSPESVLIMSVRPPTPEETAAREQEIRENAKGSSFSDWPLDRSLIAAFHVFPAIREWLASRPDIVEGVPADADAAFDLFESIKGSQGWQAYAEDGQGQPAASEDALAPD